MLNTKTHNHMVLIFNHDRCERFHLATHSGKKIRTSFKLKHFFYVNHIIFLNFMTTSTNDMKIHVDFTTKRSNESVAAKRQTKCSFALHHKNT